MIQEHEDLEEKFYISAEVEFEATGSTFCGLLPIEFEIKTRTSKKIENVRDRKSTKRELF